jgi:hypothetical protein
MKIFTYKLENNDNINELELDLNWYLEDILKKLCEIHAFNACQITNKIFDKKNNSTELFLQSEGQGYGHILYFLNDPEVTLSIKDLSMDSECDVILDKIYIIKEIDKSTNPKPPTLISTKRSSPKPMFRMIPNTEDWDDWD